VAIAHGRNERRGAEGAEGVGSGEGEGVCSSPVGEGSGDRGANVKKDYRYT